MADAPPELWLARHGDTAWTVSRQHTSRTDLELNDDGVVAARSLAGKLSGRDYDVVLTSPLRRARDTARLAGFPDAVVDDRLREFDYGSYEGLTTVEIRGSRPGWDLWTDGGGPGGETVEEVGRRLDEVVARVRAVAPTRALVFGHGHALRILAARWLSLAPAEGRILLLGPAGVGVIGSEHGRAAIERWGL